MSEPTKAVFLSYASQDAEAARRICDSLRSGGVEVWFDVEGGLEHGDEWDQKIRKQIKECVLFIAVISANTQAREEGYFRLEWDLAAERARTIASGVPFILPVVIDDTREPDALVPDRFRAVQWTRLKGGEVPAEVRARFLKLWSHRTGLLKSQMQKTAAAQDVGEVPTPPKVGRRVPAAAWVAMAVVLAALGYFWRKRSPESPPIAAQNAGAGRSTGSGQETRPPATEKSAAPLSEARQLLAKTGGLIDALDNSRDDYKLAEELIAQAKTKDPMDAEVWAAEAQLHERYLIRGWDVSDTRREAARAAAQRAIRLDPRSFEARLAQAGLLGDTGRDGTEKERQLRELRTERPTEKRVLRMLAGVIDRLGRIDESAALADESAALPGGDPIALYSKSLGFWFAGRTVEAETAIQASLAQQPFTGALLIAAWYRLALHSDVDGARDFIQRIDPAQLIEDRAAFFAFYVEFLAHRPDAAITRLRAVPRDWLSDFWYRGPKGWLVGGALDLGGRHDAAVIEWTAALKLVEQRLVASPSNPGLIYNRICLLVGLGQREEAERQFAVLLQMRSAIDIGSSGLDAKCHALLGHKAEAIKAIAVGLKAKSHAVVFPSGSLRLDPIYDSLRGEPEFAKLLAEAEALDGATPAAAPKSGLTTAAPAKADDKSVAVLAFANLSDEKANEYFSDGISEELLNVLGRVPGLRVAAPLSAFSFKGKNASAQEIGQKLNVAYLVNGSVRRLGNAIRVVARLSRATTDEQIWTEKFDGEAKNAFALQDEIAAKIAAALSLKLGASSRAAKPIDPEAYRLYLEGRHFWGLRSFGGFDRAETALKQAVALEPESALMRAGLAELYATRGWYCGQNALDPGDNYALASAEAERAVALDPENAQATVAQATIAIARRQFSEAARLLRHALTLAPNDAAALDRLGDLMVRTGQLDAAVENYQRAMQLDPLSVYLVRDVVRELAYARRFQDVIETVDRFEAASPRDWRTIVWRSQALVHFGKWDQAASELRAILPSITPDEFSSSGASIAELVFSLRAAKCEPESEALATQLLNRHRPGTYLHALVLAARGRMEEALPLFVPFPTGAEDRLFWSAVFDPVRDDPRFLRKIDELGVAAEYQVARETLARMLKEPAANK